MNIVFRTILGLYALCLTMISLVAMIVTFRADVFVRLANDISVLLQHRNFSIVMFVIEFVFCVLSIVFLLSGFKSDESSKCVSKYTDIGEIKISLNSVENIALAVTKKLNGIKDSRAYVQRVADGVSVLIKIVVMSEVNIPSLSEDVQVRVKKTVEDVSGIKVSEVKVLIENIHTGYKARVE